MIMVIIAGGSGTRLWPLSTPEFPKHLLRINNDEMSLLQHTYDRAKQLGEHVYVVSEVSHIEHVKQQLPHLPEDAFIIEPGRRGTANCITMALAVIAKKHDSDEPIAFTHADHYIRDTDGFIQSFRLAERTTQEEGRIVLVGVEADHPATGFGYIQKGDPLNDQSLVFNVRSFKEKPDYKTAQEYLQSGNYLWNGGYFVGSLNTFLESMKRFAPELADHFQIIKEVPSDRLEETYLDFESEAIDYALIEKVDNLLVVPATFDWMDLGSFQDLSRAAGKDETGNNVHGHNISTEEVSNSFIYSDEVKPLVVIGLDNVVVVDTPKGLLVARKDMSQKVGEVSKRLNAPPDPGSKD